MPLISNTGRTPLGLPTGGDIPARGSVEVNDEAWTAAQENPTVKRWVEGGLLVEGELPELTEEEQREEESLAAQDPNRVSQKEWDDAYEAGGAVPYDYQPKDQRPVTEPEEPPVELEEPPPETP